MRIAFSGTHAAGKTTLVEAVATELPSCALIAEPYHQLEEEGYEHADPPSLEDFEAQLERAIASLNEGERDALFDRCPADVLAYLFTHPDRDGFDPDAWIERACEAMATLDLVVFVPIEEPERIALPAHTDRRYRMRVHKKLENLLLDDPYEFGTEVLVVEGDLESRLAQVMERLNERS